ncbi:MAG: hypothetical protein AB8G05_10515 [Oligoflexales bacterium]
MNIFNRIIIAIFLLISSISAATPSPKITDEQKKSIVLTITKTILGKNISQFLSISVATGLKNSKAEARNNTEQLIDKKAIEIFEIFENALRKSSKINIKVIEKSDSKGFEKIFEWRFRK